MLTVRVNGIYGDQVIFQCASVIRGEPKERASGGRLEFYDASHTQCHPALHYGNVFVMNEEGKQVMLFELGGWHFAKKAA